MLLGLWHHLQLPRPPYLSLQAGTDLARNRGESQRPLKNQAYEGYEQKPSWLHCYSRLLGTIFLQGNDLGQNL